MTLPFENDTGAIVRKLADRSLKADKRRNLFVVITIIFATVLLSTLCFYLSAQNMQLVNLIRGQYQAVCAGITQELIDTISEQPEVEQWGVAKTIGAIRYRDTSLTVLYEDENQIRLAGRPDIDGRLPEAETEIMVELPFLQYLNLPAVTGQLIQLDMGDGIKRDYMVTGILRSDNTSRSFTIFTSKAYAVTRSSSIPTFDFRFRLTGGNEENMDTLKDQIKGFLLKQGVPEDKIFYSSNYFDMVGFQSSDNTMLYLVGFLLVFASSVVIYSLFYISVSGKFREYGRLKVIGTTSKQLKRIVQRETLILCLRSIPLGIMIAGCAIVAWMPEYWQWGTNLRSAFGVATVMTLSVLLATCVPIRMAGKVSAIEAVRMTLYSGQEGKNISKPLHRHITPLSLARMSFVRNRKKSVLTFISLGLTAVMLMCVATYAVSFDVDSMAAQNLGDGGNYMLSLSHPSLEEQHTVLEENPFDNTLYETFLSLDFVTGVTCYNSSYAEVSLPKNPGGFSFIGLTQEQFDQFLYPEFISEGDVDYKTMTEKTGVVIADPEQLLARYNDYAPNVGDVLFCKGYDGQSVELVVLGIAESYIKTGVSASPFLVTDKTLSKLYPKVKNFNTVWNVYTDKDSEEVRNAVFSVTTDGRIDITSRTDLADSLRDMAGQMIKGLYALVTFLFLFALVNLVNTLMTNLLAKKQEVGILQSVGMSSRQLVSMLSAECLWYVGIALILAVAVGAPAGFVICTFFNQVGIFGTLTYHFPWMAVALFTAILAIIQLCYSTLVVRYLGKQSLIDRIKAIE